MTDKAELDKAKGQGYSNGYAAGKKGLADVRKQSYADGLERGKREAFDETQRYDNLMAATLGATLANCGGWSIEGRIVKSAADYVNMTKVFVDNIIEIGPKP